MKNKIILLIIAFSLFYCNGSKKLRPELDLRDAKNIGVLTFKIENAGGVLDEIATEILITDLKRFYKRSKISLSGAPEDLMENNSSSDVSQKKLQDLCHKQELDYLFFGKVTVSKFRSNMQNVKSVLRRTRIGIKFRMEAELKLYSSDVGRVIWTGSSFKDGHASYDHFTRDLEPEFYVSDKDESYKRFVRNLLYFITKDLRPGK